mgnify:CR=1 FL=1
MVKSVAKTNTPAKRKTGPSRPQTSTVKTVAKRRRPSPAKRTPRKSAARKGIVRKPKASRPVLPRKAAEKAAAKVAAKKASVKKRPAGPAAPKAPARKAPAKKIVSGKAAPKQPTTKKAPMKKTPVSKPVAGGKAVEKKPSVKLAAQKTLAARKAGAAEAKAAVPPISPTLRFPDVAQPTGSYNGIHLTDIIKPFPKKTLYSTRELDMLREALSQERNQLIHELNSLNNTSREVMDLSKEHPGYSLHLAEHATDLQTAETSLGVRSIVQERLMQMDAALKRLQEQPDHFGLCLACGSKIGIERLRSRPHAHLCLDCRQRYERIRSRRG